MSSAPDYVQPLDGWRGWLVAEVDGKARLVSVIYHVPWPVQHELVGECLRRRRVRLPGWRRNEPEEHVTPGERCGCGIYATREPSAALDYLRDFGQRELGGWRVLHRALGRVLLWGSVVECQAGWRGARAYPQRLFVPERDWSGTPVDRLDEIALSLTDYRVPVEILDHVGREEELREALREHAAA